MRKVSLSIACTVLTLATVLLMTFVVAIPFGTSVPGPYGVGGPPVDSGGGSLRTAHAVDPPVGAGPRDTVAHGGLTDASRVGRSANNRSGWPTSSTGTWYSFDLTLST